MGLDIKELKVNGDIPMTCIPRGKGYDRRFVKTKQERFSGKF